MRAAGATMQKNLRPIHDAPDGRRSATCSSRPASREGPLLLPADSAGRLHAAARRSGGGRRKRREPRSQGEDARARPGPAGSRGRTRRSEPGEYEFRIPIPRDTNEFLTQRLSIRKPNPELDNVRNNFGYLYQTLAGDANEAISGLLAETRRKVLRVLYGSDEVGGGTGTAGAPARTRLGSSSSCRTPTSSPTAWSVVPPREVLVKGEALRHVGPRLRDESGGECIPAGPLLMPLGIGCRSAG